MALLVSAASARDVPISPEAKQQFKVGVALLSDPAGPRYEEAYGAFKLAYAASPSSKILGNNGLCAMKLERDGEAIEAYSRYLGEVPDVDPKERAQISQDLEVLKGSAVSVRLTFEPAEATLTDERVPVRGERVTNRYPVSGGRLELAVRAGHHVFTARQPGYQDSSWELDLSPSSPFERSVVLTRKGAPPGPAAGAGQGAVAPAAPPGTPPAGDTNEPERPVPASVWVTLTATGVLAVTAGVVGGLALSNHSKFEDALATGDNEQADSLKSKGQGLNIATDVLIGTASAAAVVTLILYLTRPEEAPSTPAKAARLRFSPTAGPDGGGFVLLSAF